MFITGSFNGQQKGRSLDVWENEVEEVLARHLINWECQSLGGTFKNKLDYNEAGCPHRHERLQEGRGGDGKKLGGRFAKKKKKKTKKTIRGKRKTRCAVVGLNFRTQGNSAWRDSSNRKIMRSH